jgi:excinuclease ABC subunit A
MDDLLAKTVAALIPFFETINVPKNIPLEEIRNHLRYLQQTGLEYLTLDRPVSTLSGGEQRRVSLAGILGSSLVDMLYILDEPSLGLHPSETEKLLEAVLQLRDRGNTVVLVEHDPLLLCRADYLVEFGPGAGDNGGTITFHGNFSELLNDTKSITGKYLAAGAAPLPSAPSQAKGTGSITLTGCTGNNLQNLSVSFPLGLLCVVAGVSGAGKSTLIRQTLYPALCEHFCTKSEIAGLPFEKMTVSGTINGAVLIDQTPMGRSSSSNPVTYLKVFDEIRNVFSATPDAQAKNMTARHFSFNAEGGRCEHCKGDGSIVIDMQFLPDQVVRCPECQGKRYRTEVLDILYRGKNIAEVLEMTAREAFSFFRGQNKLQQKLKRLFDVGLDYLRIGQSTNKQSGGEAQRLKLAAYLSQIRGSRSLILMDDPTAGLHFADVEQLLDCFRALIAAGHSLIVIEHNEMVIRSADHRIELVNGKIIRS